MVPSIVFSARRLTGHSASVRQSVTDEMSKHSAPGGDGAARPGLRVRSQTRNGRCSDGLHRTRCEDSKAGTRKRTGLACHADRPAANPCASVLLPALEYTPEAPVVALAVAAVVVVIGYTPLIVPWR
jgi:hypothetical protein